MISRMRTRQGNVFADEPFLSALLEKTKVTPAEYLLHLRELEKDTIKRADYERRCWYYLMYDREKRKKRQSSTAEERRNVWQQNMPLMREEDEYIVFSRDRSHGTRARSNKRVREIQLRLSPRAAAYQIQKTHCRAS